MRVDDRIPQTREISVRPGMRGGPERTRTACQVRSRYRTVLSRVIHLGNSAIKCRRWPAGYRQLVDLLSDRQSRCAGVVVDAQGKLRQQSMPPRSGQPR